LFYLRLFLVLLIIPLKVSGQNNLVQRHQERASNYFKISKYDSSAYHYEEAISLCRSCPDSLKASLNLSLYKTYKYNERFEDAYVQLTKAEIHSKKAKSDEHLALTYIAFAEHFRSNRKYEKADVYLDKAKQIIAGGKVSDATLGNYYNRKAAVLSEGHFDNEGAIQHSLKNIEIAKKLNAKKLEAVSLNEIGFAYEKMNQFVKSISYYKRAIEIWDNLDEEGASLANSLGNLVRVYIKDNQYNQALKYNTMGYELAKQKKFSYWVAVFTYQQYQIFRHQNKLKQSLETLEKYVVLNDDYSNKQWANAIAKAENEYEAKQKDNQIKLNQLELKNRELQLKKNRQNRIYLILAILFVSGLLFVILIYSIRTKINNRKLNVLLKENQFLLGESNHRIKNNLQLIIALVHQEMEKQKVDLEQSSLFEIVEKIEAVSALHKQLYTNDSKQLIRIDSYINQIKDNFDKFFQKRDIQMDFDIDPLEISINKSLYLGILCTELLLNSLKHAFKDGKPVQKITLTLKAVNGEVSFKYSDSGPGLSSPHTKLKLIHLMSQQMKFNYEIKEGDHFLFIADLTGKL